MRNSENPINNYRDALDLVLQANNNYSQSIKKLYRAVESIDHEPTQEACQRLLSMAINGTREIERISTQKSLLLSLDLYPLLNTTQN